MGVKSKTKIIKSWPLMKDEKTVTIGRKSERMVVNMGKLIDLMVI